MGQSHAHTLYTFHVILFILALHFLRSEERAVIIFNNNLSRPYSIVPRVGDFPFIPMKKLRITSIDFFSVASLRFHYVLPRSYANSRSGLYIKQYASVPSYTDPLPRRSHVPRKKKPMLLNVRCTTSVGLICRGKNLFILAKRYYFTCNVTCLVYQKHNIYS